MRPVSIRDVAALADVSVGTVSNVLNHPEQVAATTRARVRAAVTELGFVRNESARQPRAGRGHTLGLVVLDVSNPFFTDVARGVENAARRADYAIILCTSDELPDRENRHLDMLIEHRAEGVLITRIDVRNPRLPELRRRGTPVVFVDRMAVGDDECSVSVDDVLGGRLARNRPSTARMTGTRW